MLTQKANTSQIDNPDPKDAPIKKQKTQYVTDKERQASDRAKQPVKAQDQIMFAQPAHLNGTNFEINMIE